MRVFRDEPVATHVEEKSLQKLEANELRHAVQNLSMADQQIIYLRYFLDLSVAETSQTLQIAEGTVKSRLSRALDKLRKVIERDFPVLADRREGRKA